MTSSTGYGDDDDTLYAAYAEDADITSGINNTFRYYMPVHVRYMYVTPSGEVGRSAEALNYKGSS